MKEASAQVKEARTQVTVLAERAGAAAAAQEALARAQRDLGACQEQLARSRTKQERLATENTQLRAQGGPQPPCAGGPRGSSLKGCRLARASIEVMVLCINQNVNLVTTTGWSGPLSVVSLCPNRRRSLLVLSHPAIRHLTRNTVVR
jgi:hypothetical protein